MSHTTALSNRKLTTGISVAELKKIHAYWRAANYLSVGQIYLMDNPLLKEPLKIEHIKPRLLGHWGTTPGLNFIYVHMNRMIKNYDLNAIFLTGPGHGGPALLIPGLVCPWRRTALQACSSSSTVPTA